MTKEKCRLCDVEFRIKTPERRQRAILNHLSTHHPEVNRYEFLVEYENFKAPKCEFCGEDRKRKNLMKFYKTCRKEKCIKKSRALSEETKKKIGEGQRKYLQSLKGTHLDKFDKTKQTYWERFFKENVLEKERLFEKYKIVQEYRELSYRLDFAIFGNNCKIDLEIDGWQHFKNEKIIKKDIRRNEDLLKNNWKIYRVTCKSLKNNFEEEKRKFLEFLDFEVKEDFDHEDYVEKRILKYSEIGNRKVNLRESGKIEKEKNIKSLKDKISKSNIDFSSFGWATELSETLGFTSQASSRWLKKNMPEFYEDKCFKRKVPVFQRQRKRS